MTTRRNRKLEDEGTVFIQNTVRLHNCIFQEVELRNDQGNDCYIEFITDEVATSFCVFAQIKSGNSYKDKSGYKIPADSNHLEYWKLHTNPIAGIVYDEQKKEGYWVNISEYVNQNPQILEQKTHSIRVSATNRFSDFNAFKNHFTDYIQKYKSFENYGKSLDNFAKIGNPHICHDGFKSLYTNHRNRSSAWFYIISSFGKIKEPGIHQNILGVISNYIPSDDIFWSKSNKEFLYKYDLRKTLADLLTQHFKFKEVSISLDFIRNGVVRGTFSYRVFKVLSLIADIHKILLEITYSETDAARRDFDFWLFIYFAQWQSKDYAIAEIEIYFQNFKDADSDGIIRALEEAFRNNEEILIG